MQQGQLEEFDRKSNSGGTNGQEQISLVDRLLELGLITQDQLNVALKEQTSSKEGEDVTTILLRMGFVGEKTLASLLSSLTNTKDFDLKSMIIDQSLVKMIPKEFALANKIIAVDANETTVFVATVDIFNILIADQLKRFLPLRLKIQAFYAPEADILNAIEKYYGYNMTMDSILREMENQNSKIDERQTISGDYRSPTVRLVDTILADAVKSGASDLHFEPDNFFLRLRYRIDGEMEQIKTFHKDYWNSMLVRIKIISNMNIAETRKAQDGRINARIAGRNIDFRVSSQPTVDGENIVMRILDEKQSILDLDKLGYLPEAQEIIKRSIRRPEGMIVITGPTGSGKTTTLYTILNMINSIDKNIMTLENPVEYRLSLVRQTNINADIGLDFADGIRTLMRQDPDIILVGEIRDRETAVAAVQAAMTGHQVYSSLHTNDAYAAIPRLVQIGIEPFLLSNSLICVIAQRLARKLCEACKERYPPDVRERSIMKKTLGEEKANQLEFLYKAKGCDKCRNSGYKGRLSVAEIISVDRELSEMIACGASKITMINYLDKKGEFASIQMDGLKKIALGYTTFDEIANVIDMVEIIG